MARSWSIAAIGAWLCLGLCLSVRGDEPPAKPKTVVTVTRTDGTSVRGQIVSSDPDQIVIQPVRKPGEKTDPEQITLTWKQIKALSNGITQQKVLDEWKQEHRQQLCTVCHGNRFEYCKTCKGTGHDPSAAADCKTCKGELLVDCKQPRCDKGQVPCPATCIKRYEGNWVPHDGMIVRYFTSPKGQHWYSETHVGQLLVLDKKTGELRNEGQCPTCGGTTWVECPTCHGLGKVPCPTCAARKDAPPCPASCDGGKTPCMLVAGVDSRARVMLRGRHIDLEDPRCDRYVRLCSPACC